MKIGVIGGGDAGGDLARIWRFAGHDVQASSRDTVAETAAHGDVTVPAVPASAIDCTLAAAGSLEGRVLVEATDADVVRLAAGVLLVKAP